MTDCNNKHMYFELLTRLKSWFNDSQQTSWISEKISKDRPQGPGWVRENGQFSFISRPTAPSKRVLSENLFGTLQSSGEKNIGRRLKRDPFPFSSSWKKPPQRMCWVKIRREHPVGEQSKLKTQLFKQGEGISIHKWSVTNHWTQGLRTIDQGGKSSLHKVISEAF